MRAVLGLFELKARAACDDVLLEVDVILQNFLERQGLWLAVHNGQHDDAEGRLHLRKCIKLVQHNLRGGVALDRDDNAHALAVGVVLHVGDAVDALFLDERRNALDQARLVHLVGDLRDHNAEPAVLFLLDFRARAHRDAAAARRIGRADAPRAP